MRGATLNDSHTSVGSHASRMSHAWLRRVALLPLQRFLRFLSKPLYWWYERHLYAGVAAGSTPAHIGLILDGNRRFARDIGLDTWKGHQYGVDKIKELLEWCQDLGIANVTIFVFSTENFSRTPREVTRLLDLFVKESRHLLDHPGVKANKIRVRIIGQRHRLPDDVLAATEDLETATADHEGMLLNIALGYSGREEITDAVRKLLYKAIHEGRSMAKVAESLTTAELASHLYTVGVPDPDFIIRTSGEQRLSGFFLWQAAYSEYYFCDALWPAFRRIDFMRAIRNYQQRNRRFGR